MKIAIHKSGGFSERWINYCQKNNIDYKIVNAYDSDIIKQMADCDDITMNKLMEEVGEIQEILDHGGFYTIVNVGDRMVFEKKHYLFPLATAEILMNPALEQNPGWPKLSTATN